MFMHNIVHDQVQKVNDTLSTWNCTWDHEMTCEGKSDEVFYFTENVVHKIGLPIPTTQRANTFTFDQDIV